MSSAAMGGSSGDAAVGNTRVEVGTVWRIMAERMTQSWTTVPHFYLMREVAAVARRDARAPHPRGRKACRNKAHVYRSARQVGGGGFGQASPRQCKLDRGGIQLNPMINIGLATAIEEGLIVPVVHAADKLSVGDIAARRQELVTRANAGKLRPADISGGTFTLTNLGMYNVDAFNAIVNTPQAAILAVGRIADRVVAVGGQPAVRPMMTLALSCDHRLVDGARAARFLDDLARLIEEPWGAWA